MGTIDWVGIKGKRLIYQEFIAGTGGDIFANLAGGCSKGTTGISRYDILNIQDTIVSRGFNSPDKQSLTIMINCSKEYSELPVLENYIQCMYLAGNEYSKENKIKSHSMWISNHPIGPHLNVDIWKRVANNLECNILCINPVITTYESYSWAIHIINLLVKEDTGRTENIATTCRNFNNSLLNYSHYTNDVLRYNHLDDIINNRKYKLFKFCKSINSDIEQDTFDFVYNNYREIRMPLWEKFNKQHKGTIRNWWTKYTSERKYNGLA